MSRFAWRQAEFSRILPGDVVIYTAGGAPRVMVVAVIKLNALTGHASTLYGYSRHVFASYRVDVRADIESVVAWRPPLWKFWSFL